MIESLVETVKIKVPYPSLPEITCAASLAHHRLLGPVRGMRLKNVDLSTIPSQHMASLSSCVVRGVIICNVTGCDLVTILDSLKCGVLSISFQRLGREETQALVEAMESHLVSVTLSDEVTLDIRVLARYSGQGVCKKLTLYNTAADKYREDIRTLARSKNLKVHESESSINICFT